LAVARKQPQNGCYGNFATSGQRLHPFRRLTEEEITLLRIHNRFFEDKYRQQWTKDIKNFPRMECINFGPILICVFLLLIEKIDLFLAYALITISTHIKESCSNNFH
jgi:hypothetical protein